MNVIYTHNTVLLGTPDNMSFFFIIGELEVFHSVLLKYCPKNLHFHYASMAARTQLAILDHNENVHRPQATTATGMWEHTVLLKNHSISRIVKTYLCSKS